MERALLDVLRATPLRLSDIATINNGVQTSAEKIFVFEPHNTSDGCYSFGDPQAPSFVELDITRPYLKSSAGLKLYNHLHTNHRIIYPYEKVNGVTSIITPDRFQQLHPNTWLHLIKNKSTLESRDVQPEPPSGVFYSYGRHQALETSSSCPKIIYSVNQKGEKYAIDYEGLMFASGGTAGEVSINLAEGSTYTYEIILALLSYPLTEFFLRKRGSAFRGGYYARGSAVMSDLPIPVINASDATHMVTHASITQTVRQLTHYTTAANTSKGRAREIAISNIAHHRFRLLSDLDKLWGLSEKLRATIKLPGG